jgi:hypothetical protein
MTWTVVSVGNLFHLEVPKPAKIAGIRGAAMASNLLGVNPTELLMLLQAPKALNR